MALLSLFSSAVRSHETAVNSCRLPLFLFAFIHPMHFTGVLT